MTVLFKFSYPVIRFVYLFLIQKLSTASIEIKIVKSRLFSEKRFLKKHLIIGLWKKLIPILFLC